MEALCLGCSTIEAYVNFLPRLPVTEAYNITIITSLPPHVYMPRFYYNSGINPKLENPKCTNDGQE